MNRIGHGRGRLLMGLLLLGLAGCAGLTPPVLPPPGADCNEVFRQVDRLTAAAACRNVAFFQPDAYPFLRTSRFWTALGAEPLPPAAADFRRGQLAELDRQARTGELRCLLPEGSELAALQERLDRCRTELVQDDDKDSARLQAALAVPDDYSLGLRTLGLYPLVRWPFAVAVADAYDLRREWFQRDLGEFLAEGIWQAVGPGADPAPLPPAEVTALVAATAANPLGVPLPTAEETLRLAQTFAPVFVQQHQGNADGWGALRWREDRLTIDAAAPTVYYYLDHLLWQGRPRLRLNFTIWFPARVGPRTPWVERGELDGLTYGVVLDDQGRPLAAEAMNNCGCYHMFFPGNVLGAVRPTPFSPDPLVPQTLPAPAAKERIGLYLSSGWHQVVRAAPVAPPPVTYVLRPYAELEQLPRGDGRTRNVFNHKGIIEQSARVERFLFFSMGVPSVGAMRQRGHQPITLIGREHYDDPCLLEQNFQTVPPPSAAGDNP